MRVKIMVILISAIIVGGCESPDDVSFDGSSKRDNGNSSDGTFGNGQTSTLPSIDDPSDYPKTEYYGTGNIRSVTNNAIQIKTKQEISREKFITYTTSFTSSDSKINEQVVKLVGKTTFLRTTKEDLANRARVSGFANPPFLLFANSSEVDNQSGQSKIAFSSPAPFLVMPTEMHYYDALKQGPIVFDYTVSGSANFAVKATVSEETRNGDVIRVLIMNEIAQDTDGHMYDKLSMPRTSVYEIDTKQKKILRLDTSTYYYNSYKKARSDMNASFNLCIYQLREVIDQRSCGG